MTADQSAQPPAEPRRLPVPPLLSDLAGWAWRVLLILGLCWVVLEAVLRFTLVTVPLGVALLVVALLSPLVVWLRRRGLPRVLTTLAIVLPGLLVVGAVLAWIVQTGLDEYPAVARQVGATIQDLPVSSSTLVEWRGQLVTQISSRQGALTQSVLQGLFTVGKILTGAVLALLFSLILLTDGDRMWRWVVRRFPQAAQRSLRNAGENAFDQLSSWMRGTVLIGLFHAVVVAVTLLILGVPLVLPLTLIVFVGSFLPLVGALLGGGLAVLVAFAFAGPVGGLVLLAVLLIDNQIEAHVLQPFLIGRYVKLHPFVVATVITAGAIVAGLPGTLFAVPLTAAMHAAFQRIELPQASETSVGADEDPSRTPAMTRGRHGFRGRRSPPA